VTGSPKVFLGGFEFENSSSAHTKNNQRHQLETPFFFNCDGFQDTLRQFWFQNSQGIRRIRRPIAGGVARTVTAVRVAGTERAGGAANNADREEMGPGSAMWQLRRFTKIHSLHSTRLTARCIGTRAGTVGGDDPLSESRDEAPERGAPGRTGGTAERRSAHPIMVPETRTGCVGGVC
jgi:hypothetical protein